MSESTQRLMLERRAVLGCLTALTSLTALAACGGVGEDGTGAAQPAASVGALSGLADTTLTVNGVTYDKARAEITDGFGNRLGADDLRLGMWVEVTGTFDDSTGLGVAASIRVRPAARGIVTAVGVDGPSVTLLESTARYDAAATVIDGVDAAAQLAVGDLIEVHGPLGSTAGTVEATRVERLAAADLPRGFELRGRISNLDATARTMTVARQRVDYAAATLTLRQSPANGQVVRVASAQAPEAGPPAAGPPQGGRAPLGGSERSERGGLLWRVERLASDQAQPLNLGFFYAEGVTTDWQSGPRFALEALLVDATTASGRAQINDNDQRVAVLGALRDGVLVAKTVSVVQPGQPTVFRLSGAVAKYASAAEFQVRGVWIDASSATYRNGTATDLADGRRVAVIGTVLGRKIVASALEFLP